MVAKPQWGLKRTCQSCGTRFYDLGRAQIACPKCGTAFDPDVLQKVRRARPAVVAPVVQPEPAEVEELEVVEGADVAEEEEAVIEDTSELGEDKEDVADVIENVDEEGEER